MNAHRQEGPSPEQLEAFNAKRRAEGLPEVPRSMFEEVGLTFDEIPEGDNPWTDPRYVTQIALPDRETGQTFYFKVERIHAYNYHNPQIHLSGLLNGLSGKPLMTVWTLWEKLLERRMFKETKQEDEEHRRWMSKSSHMLARIREIVKPMIRRLEEVKTQYTELHEPLFVGRGLGIAFDRAIGSLQELTGEAGAPTVAEMDLLSKRLLNSLWVSDRPAIAYASDTIFRRHSNPPLKVADILRRIAKFENLFLQANVDEPGGSVAREISRFKEDSEHVRIMDGLITELLASEWYIWPRETATDRDAQDRQTESPSGDKNPEDHS